jgi:AraC-like DNA-binding protein
MTTGWYTPQAPDPVLADIASCSWTATPTGQHVLVPDGCADVLVTSATASAAAVAVVCGPEMRAWTFALPANTTAVGVRLLPGVAPVLFGVDALTLCNTRSTVGSLLGVAAEESLRHEVARVPDLAERCNALEQFVASLLHARRRDGTALPDPFAQSVVHALTTTPNVTVTELAAAFEVSPRHLHRRAVASFGYGIRVLARLMRFQRLLGGVGRPGHSLAALAAHAGFADQAHLTRDCRAITGRTPREFLREWFPTFPDMSDPYKTGPAHNVKVDP